MNISFLLNGETVHLSDVHPTTTLLDWLREHRGLTGTKEGCNEGDCGACTVIVMDAETTRPLNACILFLPQLQGKAIRTVEGIASADTLHPSQQAMIDLHGSQCGFCTPGFVTSMVAAGINGDTDHDTTLAGNLCRCTGYAPIARAAKRTENTPLPDWVATDRQALAGCAKAALTAAQPGSGDALAALLMDHPQTRLIAGATDVGLWVTKNLSDLGPVAFLNQAHDLAQITETDTHWDIGAMVTIETLRLWAVDHMPALADLLRRYASTQVRMAATLGGNIANGSPIGDSPPALIALGATLTLRRGDTRRTIPLQDFFIDYGKQDLQPCEFVQSVQIPKTDHDLRCYKISKRFDQDISALLGCFNIRVDANTVQDAKIAFGGMAGIPKRARAVERALIGHPWTLDTITAAQSAWADDFQPLSDMRASADYRLKTARNLLVRYFHDRAGTPTSVHEVAL